MSAVWLKKAEMSFLLNSSTSAVMDRFWRLLLELPELLVTRFFFRIAVDADVVDGCARVTEFR